MSVCRKDWSALSSLARQRTLEDEEEQERERRRRHRNLSSTTEDESLKFTQNGTKQAVERLPSVEEPEVPKPPPPTSKDEDQDFQAMLMTRRARRQRRQAVEADQAPVAEKLEVEEERDSLDPEQTLQQPIVPKKELEPVPRRRLSQQQRGPWAREEEPLEGRAPGAGKMGLPEEAAAQQKTSASEKSPVLEKPAGPARVLASDKGMAIEKLCPTEKRHGPEKSAALEKRSGPAPEKARVPDQMQGRRLLSEKVSIFEKSSVPETKLVKLVPKKAAASEQPQTSGEARLPPGAQRAGIPGETLPPSAEQDVSDPPTVASRLPPISLQVKIPSKDEEADTSSPTLLTYSSCLKRSSPRTISFRMSPRKDNSETTLTRSASVRLPASTVKLGEKLERYHTAIQRSESVRSPGSSRTEFMVAPAGVATKRHLFEKELASQSRAEPASSRKENLRLSGVVTSRLNLWISRSQESGHQVPQEVRREAVTKRAQWGTKSASSVDAEV